MDNKKIIERLESLITMGEKVLATRYTPQGNVNLPDRVKDDLFWQWRTSCLSLLNTLPSGNIYFRDFDKICKTSVYSQTQACVSILRAAKEDIEGGYLHKIESFVSAEVFNDFLDMAKHLLDNDYKDPAASLIGAVLEDSLRRICTNNNLTVKSDDNISSLNKKIADNKLYNRLQQREIETWNKLRDYADHGYFNEYEKDNVQNMLTGVTAFLSNYLK